MSVLRTVRRLALTIFLVPVSAFAAETDPTGATRLFERARAAMTAGDVKEACSLFAESQRLDPAAGTLLNLADCEAKLGHPATAWGLFRDAASQLPESDPRNRWAMRRAAALESKVARVVLMPPPGAEGATVFRDDVEVPSRLLRTELFVDPGPHVVSVRAPGHVAWEHRFEVEAGATRDVQLQIGAPESQASSPVEHGVVAPSGLPAWMGWSSIALGGVGVSVGAVTGLMALDQASIAKTNCNANLECNDAGLAAGRQADGFATASTVAFVAGAVLLTAGIVITLTSRGRAPR